MEGLNELTTGVNEFGNKDNDDDGVLVTMVGTLLNLMDGVAERIWTGVTEGSVEGMSISGECEGVVCDSM